MCRCVGGVWVFEGGCKCVFSPGCLLYIAQYRIRAGAAFDVYANLYVNCNLVSGWLETSAFLVPLAIYSFCHLDSLVQRRHDAISSR